MLEDGNPVPKTEEAFKRVFGIWQGGWRDRKSRHTDLREKDSERREKSETLMAL